MIKAVNLSKKFVKHVADKKGKTKKTEEFLAVNDISFTVGEGEIVGILGPNGAGKTTLLRMLGGLMEPTSGAVCIQSADGEELRDVVEIKRHIGYLSGNTKLYHRFSTREMLHMLGEIYQMPKDVIERRTEEIFEVLSMQEFGDNRIEKLSTGQTQRASIARCLIHDPEIYIFDEPTLGLDIMSADAIVRFMKEQKERKKTVLYSTHYLEEAQFLCDRIIMIDKGRIIAKGSPNELMEAYKVQDLRSAFHAIMDAQNEETEEMAE